MARARYVVQVVPDDFAAASPTAQTPNQGDQQRGGGFGRVQQELPPDFQPTPQQTYVHHQVAEPEPLPEIRSRILQRPLETPQHSTPDLFSRADHINNLLRETQMEEMREPAVIQKPRTPKRLQETASPSKESNFRQTLGQQQQVQRIEHFYKKNQEPEQVPKPLLPSFGGKLPRFGGGKKFLISGVIVAVILAGAGFGSVVYAKSQLNQTEQDVRQLLVDLQEGQWQSAKERSQKLQQRQAQAKTLYRFTRPVARVVFGKEKATNLDQLFEVSEAGLSTLKVGFETQDVLEKGFRQFTGKEDGKSLETFSHLTGQSEALYSELSGLQSKVDRLDNPFELAFINDLKQRLSQDVPRMRKYFAASQKIGSVLPDILGEDGKRQYLVLLQNNMELRPTGGFIGSFGILTVQNGKFLDFRVEDVYEADGQLAGFVTPPPEIVQYLGEAKWYLRDVNWNPDFPVTAQQALWFLDKETSVKADGVIAINLHVAQKLLEVTGPIELVDYNEVITKDNLYVRAQSHSEMNFFPGSTQKRDFLSALANQLFYRIMKEDTPKLPLAQAFYTAAEESQLMMALNSPQAAQVVAGLGWDGSVRTPPCPPPFHSQTCFVDTVMQVEANVGVNKANQYVQREIAHSVTLESGVAKHERRMKIQNTARSNAWPEGVYRTFLRLYVPKEAQLRSVQVAGQNIDLESVKNAEENGKRVFGVYTEVAIQTTNEIILSYDIVLPQAAPLVYSLFEQKQSGVSDDDLRHTIQTVGSSIITVAPQPKVVESHQVVFESDRRTHDFLAVEVQ